MGDEESPHFFSGVMMQVPKHIAIIMDGNGRWAKRRGLERLKGHLEGMKRVGEVITVADELGVEVLTLYTFSKQNWKRPETEVKVLMQMICMGLEQKAEDLVQKNFRFNFIGQVEGIPDNVLKTFTKMKEMTSSCTGLRINLAFNYSGRSEIIDGVKEVVRKVQDGVVSIDDIDEGFFSQMLYTKGLQDPDLLIRTSGEKRISNFLLWQLSYTELYFTDIFWPDFTGVEFRKAIEDYQSRERRFGAVEPIS